MPKLNKSVFDMRMDARESAFFARELEFVKKKTFDTKFKPLKFMSLLPVSTEADNAAEEITFRSFTAYGIAKIIADYSEDLPVADVLGDETTVKVKSVGMAFKYSIQEIRRSQREGRRLDARRAEAARRSINQKLNSIAWSGDADYSIQGFLSYPGITEYTVPNDGTGTTKTWSTKTPDQIVRDMVGMVTAVVATTNGVEDPDTMILPIEQFELISTTRMTGNTDTTIMKYFLDNNPHIKSIEWLPELNNAGAGGSIDRMMVYSKSDDNVTFELPQPIEQFAPQEQNLAFKVSLHSRTAGVIVYFPLSVAFGDGI